MSSVGNRGRFSERIKKIALMKNKKKIILEDSDMIYKNFLKVVAAIPLMVYDNVVNDNVDINSNDDKENNEVIGNDLDFFDGNKVLMNNLNIRKINNRKISDIDVTLIKKNQDSKFGNVFNSYNDNSNKIIEVSKIGEARELEKKIINLIKKNLIKTVNELEILQSELYIINEVKGDDKTLTECQRNLDEVKKILCKIDKLKKKYDFLRDNYDFEYMLEIDDSSLVDNIIELKDKFSNNEVKAMVCDYKLLDVYKYLYLRIDQIQEDTYRFEEYKEQKLEELRERDINFDKLKSDVYNVDKVNGEYDRFVKNQDEFLHDLEEKISKIDSYEAVNYKLKGFNEFLLNSFKYVGLLMLSPLKGVIPSIATETLITRNVVGNLYNNLEWEENKRMVYNAIDYSSSINGAINDLDYTSRIVDGTLEDIVNLKIRYNEQFRKYQGDFSSYEEVIGRINDMENKILGNKIKIEIMKKKMLEKEKQNVKKLELVKELNKNTN
ncbi:MAG: hypothetical protein IJZ79_05775 [Bacilli bacterium]|nr:hypothetical protein [Bacilli bacterium]